MQQFLRAVANGVGTGALDALLALGIVLIYRTTGVLNFAQASIGAFGSFCIYAIAQAAPLLIALPGGVLMGAACGFCCFATINTMRAKSQTVAAAVATLALSILLQQLIAVIWGPTEVTLPNPFPAGLVTFGDVSLFYSTVFGIVVTAVLVVSIGLLLKWTKVGTMVRAVADNSQLARLSGGNAGLLIGAIWAVSGALATLAGFFVAEFAGGLMPSFLDTFLIAALIAAVLGGLHSLTATFLGAIGIEIVRNLFVVYEPNLPIPDYTAYTQTFVIFVLIVVLVIVPRRWLAQSSERRV
jgi:branched-chain amino acid transport system permease protein